MFRITLCNVGRNEVGPQHALRRTGLFNFRNHSCLALIDLVLNGTYKITREDAAFCIDPNHRQRFLLGSLCDFFVLDRDNFFENIAHATPPAF